MSESLMVRGMVEAGYPSPAEEALTDILSLDSYLGTQHPARFLLKVTGDSMNEAGILPGDLVLVDRSVSPKDGDIVIAYIDQQWTMKYYHTNGARVSLVPANRRYASLIPTEELTVIAVIMAVIRKY